MTWTYNNLVFNEPGKAKKERIRMCIILQSKGLSDAEIAKRLGYKNVISISGLRASRWFHQEAQRMAPKLKSLIGKKVSHLTNKDLARIRKLHDKGLNNLQIAAEMPEWNPSTIQRHLKKLGLRPPKKAHLSTDEKTKIIRMREKKITYKKIGEAVNRPINTVANFCVRHFGYTKNTPAKNQSLPEKLNVSQNGSQEIKSQNKLYYSSSNTTLVPFVDRTPDQIAQEIKSSLQENPRSCDAWHASKLSVVEILVSRARLQLGIPTIRQLKIRSNK